MKTKAFLFSLPLLRSDSHMVEGDHEEKNVAPTVIPCPHKGMVSTDSRLERPRGCGHARFGVGGAKRARELLASVEMRSSMTSSCAPLISTSIGRPPTVLWAENSSGRFTGRPRGQEGMKVHVLVC